MRFLLLAMPLLLLGGCGSDEPVDNGANVAEPALRKGPMLGSVDLSLPVRAGGTSPFWALEIDPGRITYASSDRADAKVTDFYPVSPRIDAGHAIFDTQTPEGEKVTITLTLGPCAGRAGDPLAAELKIGARSFTGCAGAKVPDKTAPVPDNASAPAENASAGG